MLRFADIAGLAEHIGCPVTILAGPRDPARRPALHQAFAARIPRGVCEVVDSGHFMAVQMPARVAAAIVGLRGTVR